MQRSTFSSNVCMILSECSLIVAVAMMHTIPAAVPTPTLSDPSFKVASASHIYCFRLLASWKSIHSREEKRKCGTQNINRSGIFEFKIQESCGLKMRGRTQRRESERNSSKKDPKRTKN